MSVKGKSDVKRSRKGVGGRPTLYRPDYCQGVIDHMGQGYSLTAFAGSIRVAVESVYEWQAKFPEFAEAVKIAKAARVSVCEGRLMNAQNAQVTACIFQLKNAAPDEWRDRTENTQTLKVVNGLTEDLTEAIRNAAKTFQAETRSS
jgi:hypothetical protein